MNLGSINLNQVIAYIQIQEPEKLGTIAVIALLHIQSKRFTSKECQVWYEEIQYLMEELPIVKTIS